MIPLASQCCVYEIEEQTKQERAAVLGGGDIVRWGSNGKPDQQWVILPQTENRCLIMSVAYREYMSVGSNGDIVRWSRGGDEQLFNFVNYDSADDTWNIQESTRSEYVAVGWDGDIIRWGWSGGSDQKFKLLPQNPKPVPATQTGHSPGQVPDAPRVTALGVKPPEKSDRHLIGEVVVPAHFISDPAFGDPVIKVMTNPYYILKREQYWDNGPERGYYWDHGAGVERTYESTIRVGITQQSQATVERTLGFKTTLNGQISFKLPVRGGELGGMASISHEITQGLKVTIQNTDTLVEERVDKITVRIAAGQRQVQVGWSLVDHYSLRREDGTIVYEWEVVIPGTLIVDSYS
jgi:Insecticidal Crystal Toxin, P42